MKNVLQVIEVIWRGTSDLICHNGDLADPLNAHSRKLKKISSRRKKTDEDHYDLARAEFEGSLYMSPTHGISIPVDNILATIVGGGKKSKMGREVTLGVFAEGIAATSKNPGTGDSAFVRLDYNGPRDVEALWGNGTSPFVFKKGVKVSQSRVMRTRPKFPAGWTLNFLVSFDPTVLNEESVVKAMQDGGALIGICDWRPRFGKFEVELVKD
jgi:hypothetical protein